MIPSGSFGTAPTAKWKLSYDPGVVKSFLLVELCVTDIRRLKEYLGKSFETHFESCTQVHEISYVTPLLFCH